MNNNNDSNLYDLDNDLEVNRQNEEQYNSLIEHSRQKDDAYWDRNNPVIKVILTLLLIIAVVGTLYYVILWLNTK